MLSTKPPMVNNYISKSRWLQSAFLPRDPFIYIPKAKVSQRDYLSAAVIPSE